MTIKAPVGALEFWPSLEVIDVTVKVPEKLGQAAFADKGRAASKAIEFNVFILVLPMARNLTEEPWHSNGDFEKNDADLYQRVGTTFWLFLQMPGGESLRKNIAEG
jgi:hypothetical protein